ncbi:hypothetical protein ACFO5X_07080 [Seohaeicola nanhaiensis]|uniref:Uncharacterized protein n=1 Tax=Seohaeicola nanhaiensis TaxID=1387282 RepID=A0ABV9KE85_9RHOB
MTIRVALWLLLVPVGWLGLLAGVMLVSDVAPAALVMLPSDDFLADLPQGVAILSSTPVSVTLTSEAPGLAAALYASGAWLVLPAGLAGCAPRGA